MTYSALLFDLFDTLVLFNRERLPELEINGKTVHSTAGQLYPFIQPYAPGVSLEQFYEAILWSWQEAEKIRCADHREVSAPERFGFLFRHLGLGPSAVPTDAFQNLLSSHKRSLAMAAVFPDGHRTLLQQLSGRYRFGLVSNFDYTPTAHFILEREGVAHLFETVVVSDEVGWRKPKPIIFETAFARMGIGPRETLFVGDRAEIDVLGAKGVGMDVAWINREGEPLPEGIPAPDYELTVLEALGPILAV
jgi:HAD superfamily hydrolase (TIGR01509 family)